MIGTYAADLFHLSLGHRLFIGHDGECLHNYIRELWFLRLLRNHDEIIVILFLCAELVGTIEFQQHNAGFRPLIFLAHFFKDLLGLIRGLVNDLCQFRHIHGFSHGKKDCLQCALLCAGQILLRESFLYIVFLHLISVAVIDRLDHLQLVIVFRFQFTLYSHTLPFPQLKSRKYRFFVTCIPQSLSFMSSVFIYL